MNEQEQRLLESLVGKIETPRFPLPPSDRMSFDVSPYRAGYKDGWGACAEAVREYVEEFYRQVDRRQSRDQK